jgi:hypothetical protein
MKTSAIILCTLLAVATLGSGCGNVDPAQWRFGENITGLQFEIFDKDEGIFPSTVVLLNPRNPFVGKPIGEETRFQILTDGGNTGAFYCWATLLATDNNIDNVENGKRQFYAATSLRNIHDAKEVEERLLPAVKDMAIRGFQSVLDNFPDSLIFDATGTIAFRLATPAYKAIIELGGKPPLGWVLVTAADGSEQAVQGGSDKTYPPDPAFAQEEDE